MTSPRPTDDSPRSRSPAGPPDHPPARFTGRRTTRVHVWTDNRVPGFWYGEGIYQFVIHLITNFTELSAVIYVHPHDDAAVRSLFRACPHVAVETVRLPWLGRLLSGAEPARSGRRGVARWLDVIGRQITRKLRKLATNAVVSSLRHRLRRAVRAGECVYFPNPTLAFDLEPHGGPCVVSFWDNFVAEFPQFEAARGPISLKLRRALTRADLVVTQSQANRRYLEGVLGLRPDAIEVVELGGNDYAPVLRALPAAAADPRSLDSVGLVDLWRRATPPHDATDKVLEWSVLYRLREDLRPDDKLLMISTQDRPHKNLDRLLEVVDALKRSRPGIRLMMTTVLTNERRREWNRRFPWTVRDLFEFPRLAPPCHALLYRLADLVIHPSLVEGGPTPFPAFEAASLGTPALMQEGRHTRELAARVGDDTRTFCVDLFDPEATARIGRLLDEPAERAANIRALMRSCDPWHSVSRRFEAALVARMTVGTASGLGHEPQTAAGLPSAA